MNKFSKLSLIALTALTLNACALFEDDAEKKLEGDRLSLYDFEKTLQSDPNTQFGMDGLEEQSTITLPDTLAGGVDDTMSLVAPWDNQFWPQVGGYPNHTMKHLAFGDAQPKRQWSTSIGRGTTKRSPLTSPPTVGDGKVFTLSTRANAQATDAKTGKVLWTKSVLKKGEDEAVIGGGTAFSGNMLYVTNGFDELLALNPNTGKIIWRTSTPDPVRGAPAAIPGRVFVTTMNNKTLGFDAANGQLLWQHSGLTGGTSILGASTPAIDKNAVITAYTSGEVYALRIENGQELWGENLSPIARAAGAAGLSDIRALPVIDKGIVYTVSNANRLAAIDMRTGTSIWQASIGSSATPWVSGNRVYVIGSQNTLIALNNENGDVIWQSALPRFEDPEDRTGVITWQGPILAGNRLMAFSSHGMAQEFNPVDGSVLRTWDIGGDVMLSPAVALRTLYMVNEGGNLSAWK